MKPKFMSCTEPNSFSQPAPVTLLTTTIALVQLNLARTSLTVATQTHTLTLSTVFLQKHTQQFHPRPTLNSPEVPKSCCYFYSARFYSRTHTNTLAWACVQPACVSMQLQMSATCGRTKLTSCLKRARVKALTRH